MKLTALWLILLVSSPLVNFATPPEKEEAHGALEKAVNTLHSSFSSRGGYASEWTLEPFDGRSEDRPGRGHR